MFSVLQGSTEAEKIMPSFNWTLPGKDCCLKLSKSYRPTRATAKMPGIFFTRHRAAVHEYNCCSTATIESSDTCSMIITHTHGGMSTVKSDHARHLSVYLWLNYSNILHIHGGPVAVSWCTFFVFWQCAGKAHKLHDTITFWLVMLPNIHRF